MSHIYDASTGLNFWIILPFVSISLDHLAHRSRSTTPTMITHALLNGVGMSLCIVDEKMKKCLNLLAKGIK